MERIPTFRGVLGISPFIVFLLLYVAVSAVSGDFYRMPIAVALLLAAVWGVAIQRGQGLADRIETFSKSAGNTGVLYMIWIFVLAGTFATLAKETGSVEATVGLALRFLPAEMFVPGIFIAACFISLSIGTSVGTVVALTPLAVEFARCDMANVPFLVAVVLGGAFFGDNLSFISDTTIAATRTQGCRMSDKFRTNLAIVLPAAIGALALYVFLGAKMPEAEVAETGSVWLVLPYLVIIATALAGINVTIVLSLGILSATVIALFSGHDIMSLFGFMGLGIDSVGNLIIVTLLAAGMLGLIEKAGGIAFILQTMTDRIRGRRGAMGSISMLAGIVNLCTANNTIAILTVGSLAKSIATRYGIDPRKSASLLDTSSCIVQSLIPYGAQTLLATSIAGISAAAPWRYMYYSWMLLIMVALSIIFDFPRMKASPAERGRQDGVTET